MMGFEIKPLVKPSFQNEKHFTQSVKKAAEQLRWLVYHTHNSRHSPAGFPDLVMVRSETIIYAELKMPKGKITPSQQRWADALMDANQIHYFWRPKDWDFILDLLQNS